MPIASIARITITREASGELIAMFVAWYNEHQWVWPTEVNLVGEW